MNEVENGIESRLDRLVDGELSTAEQRALMARLETEPDGWRRCALAFLESQALGAELGSLRRALDERPRLELPSVAGPAVRVPYSAQRSVWQARAMFLLAMAASFVAAFALGVVAPRYFSLHTQEPSLAGNSTDRTGQSSAAGIAENSHKTLRPLGNLRLVMDGRNGEAIEAGQLPVYEASSDWSGVLGNEQPMGSEMVELLRRSGFDVQHEQRLVPAPLEDGRQLIVPVDGYQIVPVGGRY